MNNLIKNILIVLLSTSSTLISADMATNFLYDNKIKDQIFDFEVFKTEYEKKLFILKNTGADPAYIAKEEKRLTLIEKDHEEKLLLKESIHINNCQNGSSRSLDKKVNYICKKLNGEGSLTPFQRFNLKLDGNNLIILPY